jgi:ribose transport system substrate-binding protein
MKRVIGFSNLTEESPFAVTVREGLQAAAARYPDLELMIRDNAMDDQRALANAQEFADLPVDLAIVFHINQSVGAQIGALLRSKRIPIIAIDIPIVLATYFGVNNHEAGVIAGKKLTEWIQAHWNGQVDKVLVLIEPRVHAVLPRVADAVSTLQAAVHINANDVFYLDCGNDRRLTIERVIPILDQWSMYHRIAVVGFNEDSTIGILEAARRCNRESDVIVVGQGADKAAVEALRAPNSRLIATTGYRPDTYGPQLIDLSRRILHSEKVPAENFVKLDFYEQ